MQLFFISQVFLLNTICPFSVYVPRLQASTSHLSMLTVRPVLASELFVMSQFVLVGRPLHIRFSVCTEKIYTLRDEYVNSLLI